MTTSDINLKLSVAHYLSVDCPVCGKHRITFPIDGPAGWNWDHAKQTLTPSVDHKTADCHSHFTITNGEVALH